MAANLMPPLNSSHRSHALPSMTERHVDPVWRDTPLLTLLADMPGVSRDTLDIQLDGDSLTIEGRVELELPAGMRAVWAEVQVPRFRRASTLSRELDASRIEANLKDGVLSLRPPRLAHAQARRIEVTTT